MAKRVVGGAARRPVTEALRGCDSVLWRNGAPLTCARSHKFGVVAMLIVKQGIRGVHSRKTYLGA